MSDIQYPQIEVQLSGNDGNAFAIIGAVTEAIRANVGDAEAKAYSAAAMESESYDALLQHAMRTVNVA